MTAAGLVPLPVVLALCTALGLAVGSFLNVVVYRVPAGISVVHPPSACPGCGHHVRSRDNVPVVSWLVLRGRCRDCRMPISARYPAVEAATGVAFALTAWRLDQPVVLGAGLVVVAAGIALGLIDLEHGRLPFAITGVTAGLVAAVAVVGVLAGAHVALTGPLVGAAAWFGVYGGVWLLTAGRGMGLGDVALAPVLGLALGLAGVSAAVVGLMSGFLVGAVVGGALLASGRLTRGTAVPHGPFMLAGAAVGLFAGAPLASAYLGLVGLS